LGVKTFVPKLFAAPTGRAPAVPLSDGIAIKLYFFKFLLF